MSMTLKEIKTEANKLNEAEREVLIHELLTGLEPELDNAEIEKLWIEEAQGRYEDIKSGKTTTIPGERVFHNLYKKLNAGY